LGFEMPSCSEMNTARGSRWGRSPRRTIFSACFVVQPCVMMPVITPVERSALRSGITSSKGFSSRNFVSW